MEPDTRADRRPFARRTLRKSRAGAGRHLTISADHPYDTLDLAGERIYRANFGWALLPEGSNGWRFSSSEGATPPRLVVEYATSGLRAAHAAGVTSTLAVLHTTPRAELAELADLVVGGMDDVTFGVDEESRITLATR